MRIINKPNIIYLFVCILGFTSCAYIWGALDYDEAHKKAKPVLNALEAYKKDHGEYPVRESQLCPKYLNKDNLKGIDYDRGTNDFDQTEYERTNTYWLKVSMGGNNYCSWYTRKYKGCKWLGM